MAVIIVITIVCVYASSGCKQRDGTDRNGYIDQTAPIVTENIDPEASASAVNNVDTKEDEAGREQIRDLVNDLREYLDKTLNQIVSDNGRSLSLEFVKKHGHEVLILGDGDYAIRFNGSVADDNARSATISCRADYVIDYSKKIDDVIAAFDGAFTWATDAIADESFLQYILDDRIEVRFYSNMDRTELTNRIDIFLIGDSFKKCDGEINGKETATIALEERKHVAWQAFNYYYSFKGKNYEEIRAKLPNIRHDEEHPDMLTDLDSGVVFLLDEGERQSEYGLCNYIAVPARLIFTDLDFDAGAATRKQIMEYWNVNHKWVVYEGQFYFFEFPDIRIWIDSELDGSVNGDSRVVIKEQ